MIKREVVKAMCNDPFFRCLCGLSPDHEGDHACSCGGSWTPNHDITAMPSDDAVRKALEFGPVPPQPVEVSS